MGTFKQFFSRKLPVRVEALPVFAVAVFLIYSWTIYRLFYELPSWMYYLNVGSILVLVAYALLFALVESSLLFIFVCLYSLLLPFRIFKFRFIAQGSLLVGLVCFAAVSAQRRLGWLLQLQSWQIILFPFAFILLSIAILALTALFFERFTKVPAVIQGIAERILVFAYLYVPLSLASLAVVILRNLF